MDFTLTEAQNDLAGLTRGIVSELVTNDRLRVLDAAENRTDLALWTTLASSGVLSAALPESVGGDGFGVLEQCSILVELGRGVAAVPFLTSIMTSASAIAEFGNDAQRVEWAAPAASGEKILTAALAEEFNDNPALPTTHASRTADGWTLQGSKIIVDSAPVADLFLVPALTDDGVVVFLVQPSDSGVTITRESVVDFGSVGQVDFDSVQLSDARVLGSPAQGAEITDWIVERARLGSSAYQYGVLDQALKLTAEYARERVQFGRPIGSFQAVAQRLADGYIDVKGVRLTLWAAAWRLSEGLPAAEAVQTAKFWAADAGHRVAHTAVHVHGGVGLDEDHPVHRYFLAAKRQEFFLGSATDQLRILGKELASVPA
ncbi:acyl-CoA dehydrogenase family protein [Rhodococcus sp. ARC_M6]|uniref:acyl-CoA dehydrogenase family protein n=1 Tax=Rhodococcus sp. ARC_M6 TaxID=2928852 RepID=UPI001FB44BEC|nr:acyl-CoA dehydrogenase family protein [Rhodococcus sp. ARC_M6]MCJ0902906.1 acyl-CoA/acyl-ACP dehydrogenase [Rhodococcus sp. ARC_M6]